MKLIDPSFESNISILVVFLKNISDQKINTSWYRVVNDGVISTFSHIVEQIKVI